MSSVEWFRRYLNLSKEYIERATGYKGSGTPSMSELASLCVLFGVSSEELLKDYPDVYPHNDEEKEIEHLKNFKAMMQKKN